jgi:DNA-directed RNA polymerase subunit E'/Rpb7
MNIFIPTKIKTNIQILPQELTNNISLVVYNKLVQKFEGKCSNYGYIKNNSIKVLKRNYGEFIKEHFNGAIVISVFFSCLVCNPAQHNYLTCKVVVLNNMGIKAEYRDENNYIIIEALIPRLTAGIISEIDLDKIKEGDIINIEVCGKRLNINDTKIDIIARAIKEIPDKNKLYYDYYDHTKKYDEQNILELNENISEIQDNDDTEKEDDDDDDEDEDNDEDDTEQQDDDEGDDEDILEGEEELEEEELEEEEIEEDFGDDFGDD